MILDEAGLAAGLNSLAVTLPRESVGRLVSRLAVARLEPGNLDTLTYSTGSEWPAVRERAGQHFRPAHPRAAQAVALRLPRSGRWKELVNTDAGVYGGGNTGNYGGVEAQPIPWHGQQFSAELTLPPLAALWLVPEDS